MAVPLLAFPRRLALVPLLSVLALVGCAGPSTSLTNMWRDPQYGAPMRSMMVMGVMRNYYRHIYEPGYVETEQVVRHQIDVYSTGPDGRLVWTGTSESVDPASRDEIRLKVADKVVSELVSARVLSKT